MTITYPLERRFVTHSGRACTGWLAAAKAYTASTRNDILRAMVAI